MLLSQPELIPEAAFYWEAFQELSRDRVKHAVSLGMAGGVDLPNPIPLKEIRAEAERRKLTGPEAEDFELIIRLIDDHYVRVETERIAKDVSSKARNAKRGSHG